MSGPQRDGGDAFDDLDGLSRPQLERWWQARLREELQVAYEELPFYRSRFDAAGFDPGAFHELTDLALVPAFEKGDVLAAQRRAGSAWVGLERLPPDAGSVAVTMSSGTTGTTFLAWPQRWRDEQGRSALRAHRWAGIRPGAPILLVAPAWHAYALVQPYLSEHLGVPCAVVSGTFLPRFADRLADALVSFRPRFLWTFLPMLFSLLAATDTGGREARDLFSSVESLVVAGAPVSPGMISYLQGRTGVRRVVEFAGVSENLLAVACGEGEGLHIVPDTCYVEVLDPSTGQPSAPGERGTVVLSTTVPWGSVYLRYRTGDLAWSDPGCCRCGLPSPRVKILGRDSELFELRGRQLLPYDVQIAAEAVPEVAGVPFVILREALREGRLQLVLAGPPARSTVSNALRQALREAFDVPVEVAWREGLPLQFKGVATVVSADGAT